MLSTLTQNFLWMRTVGSSATFETEARERYPDRIAAAADRIRKFQPSGGSEGPVPSSALLGARPGRGGAAASLGSSSEAKPAAAKDEEDGGELGKSCRAVMEIATEKLVGDMTQAAKKELFSHGS